MPAGVSDYCERYGENITAVCAEQDKLGARAMKVGVHAMKDQYNKVGGGNFLDIDFAT